MPVSSASWQQGRAGIKPESSLLTSDENEIGKPPDEDSSYPRSSLALDLDGCH